MLIVYYIILVNCGIIYDIIHDIMYDISCSVCMISQINYDMISCVISFVESYMISTDYAAHFYDMYVEGHTGKHLTGDRIQILLLNLPFLFRDLIAPEVTFPRQYSISCQIFMIFDMII